MIAVLLSTLFLASGITAAITIAMNLRGCRKAMTTLRSDLARCAPWRDVRITIREVSAQPTATVLRPNFTSAASRPSPKAALPAAA